MLDSYELNSSVDGSGSRSHESLVDVDCEIPTSQPIDIFDSRMVKTKQTARKGADFNEDQNAGKQPQQGIPATFPHKGKLTGKAASHMVTYHEDEDFTPSESSKVPRKMQTFSRLCRLVNAKGPLVEKLEFTSMLLEKDVISLE